ncbi:MAG: FtsX-like permease family protein [Polyangia bacterium]
MLPPLFRIAFRNVLRNRRRSLITFSAVFLALGIMVSIRGFLNGLQATIRESVVLGQTGALQVHRKGFLKSVNATLDQVIPSDAEFLRKITSVPGVKAATARIMFGGMANANDTSTAAMFTAMDPVQELIVCPRRNEMIYRGKSLKDSSPIAAILSPELASNLGVKLGQRATILTSDRDGVMNALDFDFVGEYGQPGLPLPDKKLGFVPLSFAQELLRMEGKATEIAVALHRFEDAERLKPVLQEALGPEYEVATWHDVAAFVDDAIATQNFILNLIAGVFLFVALLGIANTMLMSVLERTREIGTMMSVGVRRRQILSMFLLEASLLGLAGGILGALVGGGFVLYYGHTGMVLPIPGMLVPLHVFPVISGSYILFILALAAGGAALAALWPSVRASRMRPVEALSSV